MTSIEVNKPTVGDFIEVLKSLPQDKILVMADPDTGWRIDIFILKDEDDFVRIVADYEDMGDML